MGRAVPYRVAYYMTPLWPRPMPCRALTYCSSVSAVRGVPMWCGVPRKRATLALALGVPLAETRQGRAEGAAPPCRLRSQHSTGASPRSRSSTRRVRPISRLACEQPRQRGVRDGLQHRHTSTARQPLQGRTVLMSVGGVPCHRNVNECSRRRLGGRDGDALGAAAGDLARRCPLLHRRAVQAGRAPRAAARGSMIDTLEELLRHRLLRG